MLPGALVLYFGDEIGMTDLDVSAEARRDQMTAGDEGRDHTRTPMQWDATRSAAAQCGRVARLAVSRSALPAVLVPALPSSATAGTEA